MCYGLNYSDENKKLSCEFLKDMCYPEDFEAQKPRNKDRNPLVSVVVPVYNVEKYIAQCLDSIQNQSYKNLEILCVDDCGDDDSVKIVKEYAKSDNRIKLIKHKKNKGLGGARNTGFKKASGKYIFFIDSDDWIENNCIETVVQKLIDTDLNTVIFKADVFWENTRRRTPIWFESYKRYPEGFFEIDENNMCYLPHYSWNKGYDREFLIKNNIFWQEGVIYEDMEFFFKVFINSPKTYMIDSPLYIYRRRGDSIIGKCYGNLEKADDLYKVTKSIKDYLVSNGLMEKYQDAFLNLVCKNLNNYRGFDEAHKKLIPNMLKCLDNIKFPEDFAKYKE